MSLLPGPGAALFMAGALLAGIGIISLAASSHKKAWMYIILIFGILLFFGGALMWFVTSGRDAAIQSGLIPGLGELQAASKVEAVAGG